MEPFLGQIQLLPYNFAPSGWAFCEGQELSISQNTALFSLLGTMYGGNGTSTFALPNLKGKEPDPNMHYCIALVGIFPSRA
jgi:microcystin-dependent protein